MSANHRVVITGSGAVTPLGLSVSETWQNLLQGKSGITKISEFDVSEFPSQIAGFVKDFVPENYMDRKEARRMARFAQFSMAAAQMAIHDSGLDLAREDLTRVGIEIASAIGAVELIEEQSRVLQTQGSRKLNPVLIPSVIVNAASCQPAILLGVKGPTNSPAAACASGVYAIGQALRHLQRGDVDVMLAGGTDSAMSPLAIAAFGRLGALSRRNDDPEHACRPFDAERDGTVISEGAAVVVMETLEHAQRRDAHILAEVVGFAATEDAYHLVAPEPSGDGAARAICQGLADAAMSPDDIDYIVTHGTGTPLNDVSETRAIKRAFGDYAYRLLASSNKSMLGHMLGAAGAISTVVAVKAIQEGIIPPTVNLEKADPECDLDYVPLQPRVATINAAMVNAFGFGGQNATLIVRRYA